jgi:ATP-dependent metalloprotease
MFVTVGSLFLSVLVESSGLLKAGPRHAEFEPLQQKTVRFSDIHGVDEVKEARSYLISLIHSEIHIHQ